LDSSTVVALMQAASSRPVKTYTIAFDDPAHNEAADARRVARHIGTEHTELLVTGREALDVIPRLPDMFDEPHADPSQVPTYLVCALARREVTVALSGDGGDELFAGYNRYAWGGRVLGWAERLPAGVRHLLAAGIAQVAPRDWDRLHAAASGILPQALRQRLPGDKLVKIGHVLDASGTPAMYRSLLSAWQQPERLVRGATESPDGVLEALGDTRLPLLDRMMLCDQMTYLPDDLLTKVDRASMAVSLEARVPLLDHRVVEFSWTLPRRLKTRASQGKWILRQVLHRHVPRELVDRPKTGFSVPVDAWLRGPLKDWASDLLAPDRLARGGVLDADVVSREWQAYSAGRGSGPGMWAVLMFQAWHERWAA
jgi:asparagine synthase (glutamine-hydrolysing)